VPATITGENLESSSASRRQTDIHRVSMVFVHDQLTFSKAADPTKNAAAIADTLGSAAQRSDRPIHAIQQHRSIL
jgi:hypothetical protein